MSTFTLDNVALQLYTLRKYTQSVADLKAAMAKVHEIGYRTVQVSGFGVPYPEAKKVLADAGLAVCATHENSQLILDDPEAVCARLAEMGTVHTAYPYPAGIDFGKEESVRDFARRLDNAGAVLARNGCTLSYHNHAIELVRFGKATVLDYIYEATDPANLKAELDTYWVQAGGGNPAAWIEKLPNRQPLLHIKDFTYTLENKAIFGEIGNGNLDWTGIFAAAAKAGTEWLIVEQDDCPGDPFVSIRQSLDFLKARLG